MPSRKPASTAKQQTPPEVEADQVLTQEETAAPVEAEPDTVTPLAEEEDIPSVPEPVQEACAAGRSEIYEAVRPDGTRVRVTRNLDTGEQQVEEI